MNFSFDIRLMGQYIAFLLSALIVMNAVLAYKLRPEKWGSHVAWGLIGFVNFVYYAAVFFTGYSMHAPSVARIDITLTIILFQIGMHNRQDILRNREKAHGENSRNNI